MGIINRIKGFLSERRFRAGAIDRETNEHFGRIGEERPVNEDLVEDLKEMRKRCRDTAQNNALVRGVIETHKVDVVGPNGPTLDVQSDDEKYNKEAEDYFKEWSAICDYNNTISFSEFLRQDIESAWTCGDSISQRLYDRQADGAMKFRLLGISSDRIETPMTAIGDPDVILGVRVNRHGRPVIYYIAEPTNYGPYRTFTGKYSEINANQAIHVFDQIEPGQVRGIPWLASSLIDVANSKAFAKETLEVARSTALMGVVLYSDNPEVDAPAMPTNKTVSIPRRAMSYIKQGWKAQQIAANQPGPNYIEFQHENYRSIGRPVGMPLLTILLDARYHNYSSARYDGQVYRRHLNAIQSRLTRQRCNPCANQVLLDAERYGLIRRRPPKLSLVWGWSVPPEIDEEKTARANEIKLRTGQASLSELCTAANRSFEETVRARVRDDEFLQSMGQPTVMEMLSMSNPSQAPVEDEPVPKSKKEPKRDAYMVRMGNYDTED